MPVLMRNDTLFVILAQLEPEIWNLIIFKMADGAILDLATRKVPELTNNHFRVFRMPMLVEIDIFYCQSSSSGARDVKFHIFQNVGGGHFENHAFVELAVTFERYIGAEFPLKWFNLSNQ